jgi:hypothetical protein
MEGDNPSGADNQQGRPRDSLTPDYIAGFVDGEGCFCVSIYPHPTVRYGARYQIAPSFQVYQDRANVEILEKLKRHFGCGSITSKGPNSNVMTFSIYSRRMLQTVVVPFFDEYPLVSAKHDDFLKFREVVLSMQRKEHLTRDGFLRIVEIAFSMNQRGKQRKYRKEDLIVEPSETQRQAASLQGMLKI